MCCLLFLCHFVLIGGLWGLRCGTNKVWFFIFSCFSWCTETVDLHEGLQLGEVGVVEKFSRVWAFKG
jgi:hypothetical protein